MATLKGTTISETYPLLLKIASSGVDGTLRNIEDGDGTASALQISSNAVNINGGLTASGDVNFDSNTLFVDASENEVMIGSTTSGRGKLSVVNTGYAVLALGTSSSSGSRGGAINFENETPATEGQILYDTNSDFMQFKTAGNPALYIDSSGRVGIGETSPSERLHIGGDFADYRIYSRTGIENGTIAFNEYYTGSAWANDDSGIVSGAMRFSDSRDSLEFGVRAGGASAGYSSTHMTIRSTGRVGIGTNDPSDQLTISNSGEASVAIIGSAGVGGGDATLYLVENSTNFGIRMRYDGGDDRLYINADEDTRNLMTIERDGSGVGIGTTSPSEKLHISSTGASTALQIHSGTGSSTTGVSQIYFSSKDQYGGNTHQSYIKSTIDGTSSTSATKMSFHNRDSGGTVQEYLTIKADGNVGIGADNPAETLHIESSANTSVRIVETGGGQVKLFTPGGGFVIRGEDSNGYTRFDLNVGGSNTEIMRVTTNGLTFGGATASAHALDDYEEGTWTPVVNRITSSPTVSYSSNRYGAYTKVGNMVFATFDVTFNSISGGSGTAILSGLPFTVSDDNNKFAGYSVLQNRSSGGVSAASSGQQLSGFAQRNGAYLYLEIENSGSSGFNAVSGASWNSSGRFTGYIMYVAA